MRINIRDKMQEKQISRYELAKESNISYPTVLKIYNGDTVSIHFDTLEAICKVLDCTPNDIILSD